MTSYLNKPLHCYITPVYIFSLGFFHLYSIKKKTNVESVLLMRFSITFFEHNQTFSDLYEIYAECACILSSILQPYQFEEKKILRSVLHFHYFCGTKLIKIQLLCWFYFILFYLNIYCIISTESIDKFRSTAYVSFVLAVMILSHVFLVENWQFVLSVMMKVYICVWARFFCICV